MNNDIKIGYGPFMGDIEKQVNGQGYTLGDKAETFEEIRHAINMCGFHVATDSQVDSMFKKLHAKVVKSLKLFEINT